MLRSAAENSIIPAVGIFRFEPKFRRKFRVAAVNVWNVARQYRAITVPENRKWKKPNFKQAGEMSFGRTSHAFYDAVTRRRGVAFLAINSCNRYRNFRGREKEIAQTATEFAGRAVIVRRRILNIRERGCRNGESNSNEQQLLFHRLPST